MESKIESKTIADLAFFILWSIAGWCNKPLMQTICFIGVIVITILCIFYFIKIMQKGEKQLKIKAVKEMVHQIIFASAFSLMHILANPQILVFN